MSTHSFSHPKCFPTYVSSYAQSTLTSPVSPLTLHSSFTFRIFLSPSYILNPIPKRTLKLPSVQQGRRSVDLTVQASRKSDALASRLLSWLKHSTRKSGFMHTSTPWSAYPAHYFRSVHTRCHEEASQELKTTSDRLAKWVKSKEW